MRIRILEVRELMRNRVVDGQAIVPFAIIECPDDLARKWIDEEVAEVVRDKPTTVETAAVAPPQNAAKRTGRAKPRRKSQ
jgi:hypothetical protein